MIMLEPSSENPLNLEACSYYCSNPTIFDQYSQRSLHGCVINDIVFPVMYDLCCYNCNSSQLPFYLKNQNIICNIINRKRSLIRETMTDDIDDITESNEFAMDTGTDDNMKLLDNDSQQHFKRLDELDENMEILQRFKRMKHDEEIS